jgi:DNA-binding transcriptional regulator YiaG
MPHPPHMTLKEFLEIRKALGLSQVKMAEAMGVDVRSVRRWESGERNISGTAVILARMLAKYSNNS